MHDSAESKKGSSRGPSSKVFISSRETTRRKYIFYINICFKAFSIMEIASDVNT